MREFNKDLDLWMFNFEKLAKGDIVVRNEKYRQYRYCKFNGEPENGVFEIISLHYPRNSYWIGNATLRIMDCEDKSMIGETFFVNISQFRYAKDEELPKKIKRTYINRDYNINATGYDVPSDSYNTCYPKSSVVASIKNGQIVGLPPVSKNRRICYMVENDVYELGDKIGRYDLITVYADENNKVDEKTGKILFRGSSRTFNEKYK